MPLGYTHPQRPWVWYSIEAPRPMIPFSNYRGRGDHPANQSENISLEESTSLWITNLPPLCTHKMLLGAVRNCGKVYATVINPPTGQLGQGHATAAAKLVFFERHGVDNLLTQYRAGTLKVMQYHPRVVMNDIRKMPRSPGATSRVLRIRGPNFLMDSLLCGFFQRHFDFNLDEVVTLSEDVMAKEQEWRFGSFYAQAEVGYRRILEKKQECQELDDFESWMWTQVEVEFGPDPCGD